MKVHHLNTLWWQKRHLMRNLYFIIRRSERVGYRNVSISSDFLVGSKGACLCFVFIWESLAFWVFLLTYKEQEFHSCCKFFPKATNIFVNSAFLPHYFISILFNHVFLRGNSCNLISSVKWMAVYFSFWQNTVKLN